MAASSPGSAPPALIKRPVRDPQPRVACQSGQCAAGKQHQRQAGDCDGRCANGPCGKPGCPAHCPVRPDRFGFYGTQWRVWQGQGVVQTSFPEEATPARPPKSEIPSADEESPRSAPELPVDEESSEAESSDEASRDEESTDEQSGEKESREKAPATEPLPPSKKPAAPDAKEPAIEKPAPPAAEENLFDEASRRRRRHEVLASLQQSAMRSELARQEAIRQQARHAQAGAMIGAPQAAEMVTPSDVRTVSHEEPAPPSAPPPRVNPLR